MNCQDITRIANTGSFARLTDAEHRAAAAHALTCRHCAPVWAAHARLAELRIPPMPAELALRCRTLAALPAQASGRPGPRRLTVIGGLMALAAAASLLMWYLADRQAATPATATTALVSAPVAAAPVAGQMAPPPLREVTEPAAQQGKAQAVASSRDLPLVPRPSSRPPDPGKVLLALQKAVERHPELVQGPPLEGNFPFVVALAMRADGTVLKSAAEMTAATTIDEIMGRLQRTLPQEAGEPLVSSFDRDQVVSEGRALRARVMLFASIIPDSFDTSRSEVRVREILGNKYDDLLLSSRGEEFNVLTVFLSEDGRVLRDKVEHITPQTAEMVLSRGSGGSGRISDRIALTLGLNVDQVGMTGTTMLERGGTWMVQNPDGTSRRESTARMLMVTYAWERRANEEAATRAPVRTMESDPDFDLAAALVVAERLLPDAFSHAPPSLNDMSWATVVFTAKGEVIRAGRVQMRNNVDIDLLLQEQLVPGIHTGLVRAVRLTNKAGATAMVQFAWAE